MKIFDTKRIKEVWASFIKDPLYIHRWDDRRIYQHGRRDRDNQLHEDIYQGYSHDPFYLKSDSHMFIEDMHTGIMPFLHFRSRVATDPKFSFAIAPTSVIQRMIAEGISGRDHTNDITEACSEFIRETTQRLMIYGDVYYELIYRNEGALQSFSFVSIPNKYLIKVFGNYYQIIPWWVARKAHTRVGIIKIPSDKVLHIKFPKTLGGSKNMNKILARMYRLSKDSLPPFTMDSMKKNEETGFDSNEYSKNKYLEIAELTKEFGWNQRSRKNNYTTEYYFFNRFLNSQMANVIFREHILEKLNVFLNGPIINLRTTIQMEGFATKGEIHEWKSKLKAGSLKFLDMFNNLKDR